MYMGQTYSEAFEARICWNLILEVAQCPRPAPKLASPGTTCPKGRDAAPTFPESASIMDIRSPTKINLECPPSQPIMEEEDCLQTDSKIKQNYGCGYSSVHST